MVAHQKSKPTSTPVTQALQRWRPAVHKHWLVFASAAMWSGVGLRLSLLAFGWLQPFPLKETVLLSSVGFMLALFIYLFGFSRLAERNIARIESMSGEVCIFAFQKWSSYVLVAVMMTLGMLMRHSAFPRSLLAAMYTGIGLALFLASLHYYVYLARKVMMSEYS